MDIEVVNRVIEAYGGVKKTQKKFGYSTRMSVYIWRKRGIPAGKIGQIHMDTKIPMKVLMTAVRRVPRVFEVMGIDNTKLPSL